MKVGLSDTEESLVFGAECRGRRRAAPWDMAPLCSVFRLSNRNTGGAFVVITFGMQIRRRGIEKRRVAGCGRVAVGSASSASSHAERRPAAPRKPDEGWADTTAQHRGDLNAGVKAFGASAQPSPIPCSSKPTTLRQHEKETNLTYLFNNI